MSEERSEARDAVIAQVVLPIVGLALTYWIGTHAASIEIEVRARWRALREHLHAARTGYRDGREVAEWWMQMETPKVIARAEDIARSAAGSSSPQEPSPSPELGGCCG